MPLLELRGVTKAFSVPGGAEVEVLHGIDLTIFQGEYVAVVGASGAGKSTLLNVLGLLDTATSGQYLIDGDDTRAFDRRRTDRTRSERFGFVFQESHMIPDLTTAANIELGLRSSGAPRTSREQSVRDAAETVGIDHRLYAIAKTLSGGERQRAAFARALATTPSVILADEPTGNLDSVNGERVIELLGDIHRAGATVVVITHDEKVAAAADRRIRISDGRIVEDSGSNRSLAPDAARASAAPHARRHSALTRLVDTCMDALNSVLIHPVKSLLLIGSFLLGAAGLVAATGISETASVQVAQRITQAGLDEVRVGSDTQAVNGQWIADIDGLDHVVGVGVRRDLERTQSQPTRFDPLEVGSQDIGEASAAAVDREYLRLTDASVSPRTAVTVFDQPYADDAVILGRSVAHELGITSATGDQAIWLGTTRYAVIGIADSASRDRSVDTTVFLPERSGEGSGLYYLVRTDPGYPADMARAIPLTIDPADPGSVDVSTVADLQNLRIGVVEDLSSLIVIVSGVLLAMAVMGGAAAMNLSVRSRVAEIALRRALGASRATIGMLFLVEGAALGLAGGLAGIAIGYGTTIAVAAARGWNLASSPTSIITGLLAGLIAGSLAAIIPAWSASRLEPAQAVKATA